MDKQELTPLAQKVSDIANSGCTAKEGREALRKLEAELIELSKLDKSLSDPRGRVALARSRSRFTDACAFLAKCVHSAELSLMNTSKEKDVEQKEIEERSQKREHLAYIRVSDADQSTEQQLADTGIQFDRLFEDCCPGGIKERPALEKLKAHVRKGDTIHVHSIDRLARNLEDLRALLNGWTQAGITVRFHKERLSFTNAASDPTSGLLLRMLGAVAQFERSMAKERQREGIAKAKARGVYTGRKKTVDEAAIMAELEAGTSMRKTADKLGRSLSTVQRTAKKHGWSGKRPRSQEKAG